ncbi:MULTISPECIES: hypothetical protein [Glycomyces]|uniref:Uncharacterized protein n=2 Tax=Glycomyces TaxID=58113 RepID=A0A9X3PW43_9ACTN|nr:hypothetical protein [Glycomyces lechevalierae]MDA1386963.1 hypothetical protein [Glycomyces lechevalierae]MDR7341564.1 hypothetical protein [Glycomyces lechevalierae]
MKRIRFTRDRHQLVAHFVQKAKRFGTATVFIAGIVKVVEAAAVVWDRLVG